MSEFRREERYIVVKLKDIGDHQEDELRELLAMSEIPTRECVMVEPDWPIYDETWENVQRMAEGHTSIGAERDALAIENRKLKSRSGRLSRNLDSLRLQRDEVARMLGCESYHNAILTAVKALAAHVEWLEESRVAEVQYAVAWARKDMNESMSRLKAEWQSEALEEFGANWGWGEYRPDHKDIRQYVKRLRRQAEGGE